MKRASKIKSSAYAPVSTNLVAQNMVYMHMSSHYRRLMNVKSAVDSSLPPRRCRAPRTLPVEPRRLTIDCEDLELVKKIAFDEVNVPNPGYRDNQSKLGPAPNSHRSPAKRHRSRRCQVQCSVKPTLKRPPRPSGDLMQQHPDSFEQQGREFNPRLLKSEAESRVRKLNVYHPPRRRTKSTPRADNTCPATVPLCGNTLPATVPLHDNTLPDTVPLRGNTCPATVPLHDNTFPDKVPLRDIELEISEKLAAMLEDHWRLEDEAANQAAETLYNQCSHHDKLRDSSKVSTGSRDSAYNGGTSSGADSRGPTPEQSTEQIPLVKPTVRPFTSTADKRTATADIKQNDDTMYATFSHLITEDILLRGIFSDRGLNAVFQRHVEENKLILDMDRMKEEIAYLRAQLGVAEEVDLQPSSSKFLSDSSSSNFSMKTISNSTIDILCSISNISLDEKRFWAKRPRSEISSSTTNTISSEEINTTITRGMYDQEEMPTLFCNKSINQLMLFNECDKALESPMPSTSVNQDNVQQWKPTPMPRRVPCENVTSCSYQVQRQRII